MCKPHQTGLIYREYRHKKAPHLHVQCFLLPCDDISVWLYNLGFNNNNRNKITIMIIMLIIQYVSRYLVIIVYILLYNFLLDNNNNNNNNNINFNLVNNTISYKEP